MDSTEADTPQRDLPDEPAGPAILLALVVSPPLAVAVVAAIVWHFAG